MTHLNSIQTTMITFRPPRIAMALLLVATVIHLAIPGSWPQLKSQPIAGVAIGILGFALMIRAWWLFRRYQTAICPTAETTSFITNDVYALSRNPMYVGMVLMLLGVALFSGGWPHYVVTATFGLILNYVFARYEEQDLLDQYGAQYSEYSARVRRWL